MGSGGGFGGGQTGIGSWLPNMFDPTKAFADVGGGKNAASNMTTALNTQQAATNALNTQLLEQPKAISPDNFLAIKANQLANLRRGIASTIMPGGAPPPTLSSPTLAAGGKSKMGS